MKKILLLLTLFFISCGIPYDGDTIVTVDLNLVDANNIPIENQNVTIYSYDGSVGTNNAGYTKRTDTYGFVNFKMFQPAHDFDVLIDENLDFLPVRLIQFNKNNFDDYNLNIGTIRLFKLDDLTQLSITTNQTSGNKILQKIEVDAIKYEAIINLNSIIDASQQDIQTAFELKKNQNFILKYTIKNLINNTTEEFQENLTIGINPITYTITY